MKLLTENNPKTEKGQTQGYLTFILHLAPGSISGYNVCPGASHGCLQACLNTAGRGHMDMIQNARIRKTKMFYENRDVFMTLLYDDIRRGIKKADRLGLTPVFRLNGTSDIRWETVRRDVWAGMNIFEMFPNIQFYDYTKLSNRRNIPDNYHLTFSRSESNDGQIAEALSNGMNIAVVFDTRKKDELPIKWGMVNVVDGDVSDLRFLDPVHCIVGLRAKGRGRKDNSGFVVEVS